MVTRVIGRAALGEGELDWVGSGIKIGASRSVTTAAQKQLSPWLRALIALGTTGKLYPAILA
jgi:hypothetical protein